ncbi:hypothetical protein ACWGN5_09430 [Streptomyces sp. NPDC055815]
MGVQFVVPDAHAGLVEAIGTTPTGASWHGGVVLHAMRHYVGNWATSAWVFTGDAFDRLAAGPVWRAGPSTGRLRRMRSTTPPSDCWKAATSRCGTC